MPSGSRRISDLGSWLLILLVLSFLALGVGVTRWPDASIYRYVSTQPVVGPALERVRARFREPLPPAAAQEPDRTPDVVILRAGERPGDEETREPVLEVLHLGVGVTVRDAPRSTAPVRFVTRTLYPFRVVERQGSWARGGGLAGSAWVDLSAPRDVRPPLGNQPAKVLPIDGVAPTAAVLEAAVAELRAEVGAKGVRTGRLGPYVLKTDVTDQALLDRLDLAAARAAQVYASRYARALKGSPRAVVVLSAQRAAYERLEARLDELPGVRSSGHTAGGLVVLHAVAPPDVVEGTLLHELAHTFNRRALGPALPPWLEEGIAEEFSELGYLMQRGMTREEVLQRSQLQGGRVTLYKGPSASLRRARAAHESRGGSLAWLFSPDWQLSRIGANHEVALDRYSSAAWWIHFLMSHAETRAGFHRFLQSVSEGGAVDQNALGSFFREETWNGLSARYDDFLEGI